MEMDVRGISIDDGFGTMLPAASLTPSRDETPPNSDRSSAAQSEGDLWNQRQQLLHPASSISQPGPLAIKGMLRASSRYSATQTIGEGEMLAGEDGYERTEQRIQKLESWSWSGYERTEQRMQKLEETYEKNSRRQYDELYLLIEHELRNSKEWYRELLAEHMQALSSDFCRESDKIVAVVQASETANFKRYRAEKIVASQGDIDEMAGYQSTTEASAPVMEGIRDDSEPISTSQVTFFDKEPGEQAKGTSDVGVKIDIDNSRDDKMDIEAMEKYYKKLACRRHPWREARMQETSEQMYRDLTASHNNDINYEVHHMESVNSQPESIIGPESIGRRSSTMLSSNASKEVSSSDDSFQTNALTSCKSNMHFAQDLLNANSNQGIDELTSAMQKHDLPDFWAKGKKWTHEPDRNSFLAKILESQSFERLVSVVILLNTIFITYSTDYAVNHPYNQTNALITLIESAFQIFYIFELMLKLFIHRLFFFTNKDYLWNWLDILLALGAFYDLVMTQIITPATQADLSQGAGSSVTSGTKNGFSLTFLRVLRLVRLTKVMRIFRVMRFFSELNVLLRVVSSSLRPLFWCTCLLVVFFYIFAVIFVHGTASSLPDPVINEDTKVEMIDKFGSVWKSMLSLMQATTGGADWGSISQPLLEIGYFYYSLFLFFIVFVLLALLNILTGIFVDRAFKAVADDKDGMALEKLHADRAVVRDLCRLYCAMTGEDIDSPAVISAQAFQEFMSSPVMRARLAVLDLEIWDSGQFFKMLCSISKSNSVDLQSFVTGCMQLRGHAKRITMQAINADMQILKRLVPVSMRSSRTKANFTRGPSVMTTQQSPNTVLN